MLSDLFLGLLRLLVEFLNGMIELGGAIGRAIVAGAILVVIFWGISIATAPITSRIEQTKWWHKKFGYRHSFWEVAIPAMLLLCFAAAVLTVVWGFATGRLPATPPLEL